MTPPQPIRTDVRGIESDLQQQARLGGAPRTRCTFAGGDFRQAPPLRSSWRGGRRRPARMLGTWERKEGRREPEERSCRGFLCVFPFFFFSFLLVLFFFYVCALMEATSSREDWVSGGDPQKRTSQSRGQLRCVAESQGLPLCLTPGHKITARVGRYAHLAYLSARSKCKR